MQYVSPELVVIGRAELLVLGVPGGELDNILSEFTQPAEGIALGLE